MERESSFNSELRIVFMLSSVVLAAACVLLLLHMREMQGELVAVRAQEELIEFPLKLLGTNDDGSYVILDGGYTEAESADGKLMHTGAIRVGDAARIELFNNRYSFSAVSIQDGSEKVGEYSEWAKNTQTIKNLDDLNTSRISIVFKRDDGSSMSEDDRLAISQSLSVYVRSELLQSSDINEIDGKSSFASMSMYDKWAVLGASRDCGYIYENAQKEGLVTNRRLAWGTLVAKEHGNDCAIYAYGGATAASWIKDEENGLAKLLQDEEKQLYVISFGYNEAAYEREVGSTENCHDSLEQYTDDDLKTMYGAYSYIILNVKKHAPKALIIGLFRYTPDEPTYGEAYLRSWNCVQDIARLYGYPVINWCNSEIHNLYLLPSTYRYGGHPTAQGYSLMAGAWDELYSKCVLDNWEYFSHFVG